MKNVYLRLSTLTLGLALAASVFLGMTPSVLALEPVNVQSQFQQALNKAGIGGGGDTGSDPRAAAGNVINSLLGLIGVATFVLIVYAGALWIIAAGNEEKIEQSKRILKGCVLGLIIIFSAYIIVNFAIGQLQGAVGSGN